VIKNVRGHTVSTSGSTWASGGGSLAEHLHVHVVPRWAADANFITIIGDSKVIPPLLAEPAVCWPPMGQAIVSRQS